MREGDTVGFAVLHHEDAAAVDRRRAVHRSLHAPNGSSETGARPYQPSPRDEIDLVLDFGKELWAVEVKLTSAPGPSDMERLNRTADLAGATRRFLVSKVSSPSGDGKRISCNLPTFLENIAEIS